VVGGTSITISGTNLAGATVTIDGKAATSVVASASLITAATINPLIGLYSFLAQLVLRQPLIAASTQELYIDGTWLEPRVTKLDRKAPAK
jgi:uncharacterized protein YhdP